MRPALSTLEREMGCSEVERFVHPYLDHEFEAEEAALLDRHLVACGRCRELVAFERSFKADLKARLRRPPLPPELHARVLLALDHADGAGTGPIVPLWRRTVPFVATFAVAASVALFVGLHLRRVREASAPTAARPIVLEAVSAHEKNLPAEVDGDATRLETLFAGRVPVPVRPPRAAPAADVSLVGGRLGHLRGRDAAQLFYRVNGAPVTVTVFDPTDLPLQAERRRRLVDRDVFLDSARGYNVVFYRDRGVGYAVTSQLDEEELVRFVTASFGR